ncbi:MAG: DUF2281 domain-containing protein [Synechococcaceae cyanobacterium SM1_2_3]|nr:DUF2281 domain-containing protein [Synechococcaceae cyanobacterium SM1_2_3]
MNVEEQIIATLRVLPPERQIEVLDFAEFLNQRIMSAAKMPRPFGLCAGQLQVPDDFDAPLSDDELDLFES